MDRRRGQVAGGTGHPAGAPDRFCQGYQTDFGVVLRELPPRGARQGRLAARRARARLRGRRIRHGDRAIRPGEKHALPECDAAGQPRRPDAAIQQGRPAAAGAARPVARLDRAGRRLARGAETRADPPRHRQTTRRWRKPRRRAQGRHRHTHEGDREAHQATRANHEAVRGRDSRHRRQV